MRRFRYLAIAAVLAALMGTTLAACSQEQTPQAESLELSGQTTVFTVGEEFSTGELSVTVVYDDGTRQLPPKIIRSTAPITTRLRRGITRSSFRSTERRSRNVIPLRYRRRRMR